ncbi:MAG: metallophosphoesterase, partial [Actinomycetota bacterium]
MKFFRTAAVASLAGGLWAIAEARAYRLQEHRLDVRLGIPPLRILHLSDAHLTGHDHRRVDFIRSLATLADPIDLILMTGDMLE